jgi:C4-dicarboxylate transporter DctM subunit
MVGYMIAIAIYVRVVPGQAPEHDDDRTRRSRRHRWGVCPLP